MSGEKKKKTITIRNIDEELYAKASALARSIGETVGEVINEALRVFLSLAGGSYELVQKMREGVETTLKTVVVGDLDELTVSKSDLESVEGRVRFRNIKKLIFDNTVDLETFNSKVHSIVFVNEVVIPKDIAKLKALTKMKFVKKVTYSE
ncbi:MAG: hypothetical protein DRO23_00155 [Thermoprotei archaeon]|mgnify:CR=1 FL=1|nr:MAG: hypothetical protein DRO23_00155 [Thermoprotei archaeon]